MGRQQDAVAVSETAGKPHSGFEVIDGYNDRHLSFSSSGLLLLATQPQSHPERPDFSATRVNIGRWCSQIQF